MSQRNGEREIFKGYIQRRHAEHHMLARLLRCKVKDALRRGDVTVLPELTEEVRKNEELAKMYDAWQARL